MTRRSRPPPAGPKPDSLAKIEAAKPGAPGTDPAKPREKLLDGAVSPKPRPDEGSPLAPPVVLDDKPKPTSYTPELADRVLDEIGQGVFLYRVCRNTWAPTIQNFLHWVRKNPDDLSVRYAHAREACWDIKAEEIVEIADDSSDDSFEDGRTNHEHVNRSRLRVDTLKWLLSKLRPKMYGDRLDLFQHDDDTKKLTDAQINGRIEARMKARLEPLYARNPTPTMAEVIAAFMVTPLPEGDA